MKKEIIPTQEELRALIKFKNIRREQTYEKLKKVFFVLNHAGNIIMFDIMLILGAVIFFLASLGLYNFYLTYSMSFAVFVSLLIFLFIVMFAIIHDASNQFLTKFNKRFKS